MGKRRANRTSASASSTQRERKAGASNTRTLALALLIVAAGIWAYSTSFRGVFVWDDGEAIVDNQHLKSLWPLTESMSAPAYSTVAGRPIAAFSLALNYALAPADARDVMSPAVAQGSPDTSALFYENVWGYHAFNLAVHVLAGLTLFGVVRRTLNRSRGPAGLLAFGVALLWVVHPLQTESVTYVIQRVESLMGLFYFLTLYCAIRAWEPGRERRWWIAGSIAACACGMATKEVMATAPLLVVLWDWIFGDAAMSWGEIRRRRWPLYAGLAATWIPLGILAAGLPRLAAAGYGYGWSWWSYLVTQTAIVTHYLRLAFVPSPLVFDYGWQPAPSLLSVAPQAALLAALAAATIWLIVKRRPAGFLGAWVFLILAPSSSVIPIASEVAAEHRMYLPLAAVVAFVVIAPSWWLTRRQQKLTTRTIAVTAILILGGAATLGAMTRERNRDYWNNEELWRKTLTERPQNARAQTVYAISLLARGAYGEAETHLREAVRLDNSLALAYRNLGIALCATQRTAECVTVLERTAALEPASGETHGLLGEAYLSERQQARGLQELLQAIGLMPDNRASRFLLNRTAWLLATLPDASVRNGAKAVELAERAVTLTGRQDPQFLATLAAAYAEVDRFPEAVMTVREALAVAGRRQDTGLESEIRQYLATFEAGHKLRQPLQ